MLCQKYENDRTFYLIRWLSNNNNNNNNNIHKIRWLNNPLLEAREVTSTSTLKEIPEICLSSSDSDEHLSGVRFAADFTGTSPKFGQWCSSKRNLRWRMHAPPPRIFVQISDQTILFPSCRAARRMFDVIALVSTPSVSSYFVPKN